MNKFRTDFKSSQSGARTKKIDRKKLMVHPISNTNDEISLMMNGRTEERVIREPLHKNPHALNNDRGKVCFCLLG